VADLVVIFPALMVLFLIGVQFALATHAHHVLTAAAQDGALAASEAGAPRDAGANLATSEVAAGASHLVHNVSVSEVADSEQVTVTITAHVESLLGFLAPSVSARASAPLQHFVSQARR
jgi:Flp pilus assembly protein TadG